MIISTSQTISTDRKMYLVSELNSNVLDNGAEVEKTSSR